MRLRKATESTEDHDLEILTAISARIMTGMRRAFIRGGPPGAGPETKDELTGYEPSESTASEVVVTQDYFLGNKGELSDKD